MTAELTKNIVMVIVILAIIGGFFFGLIEDTFFYATIGAIVSHFYQGTKVASLEKTVTEQTAQIEMQSMRIKTLSLPHGKKVDIS